MSFQDAVRVCLQEKYADFNGRARRSEYWWFVLFSAVVLTVLEVLTLTFAYASSLLGGLFALLTFVAAVALIVPALAVAVRRLHDSDKSGWFLLFALVPFVGGII